jgi:uncharacterized protein
MDLNLEKPGDHLFIKSVTTEGITVVDQLYTSPIILSAQKIVTDWPVTSFGQITPAHLEQILPFEPEVVLIGTGSQQAFLSPEQMMFFYSRGIGIEAMTTDAACRTFNVLVSELRKVVAALIPA